MSEAKHTPGPWKYVPDDDGIPAATIQAADGSAVGSLFGRLRDGSSIDGREETEANGHLMAAAPDLLAVAKRVAAGGMSYPKFDRDLAAAALRKVKGGAE